MDLSFVEGLVDTLDPLNVKSANPYVGLNANACALCTYFIFPFFSWGFQPMAGPWVIGLRKPSIFCLNAKIENSIWLRVKTKGNERCLTNPFPFSVGLLRAHDRATNLTQSDYCDLASWSWAWVSSFLCCARQDIFLSSLFTSQKSSGCLSQD